MKKGGVVSDRINKFEELCVPINKANASIKRGWKRNGSNSDFHNEYDHKGVTNSSPMMRHDRMVGQNRYGASRNDIIVKCEETVVIKNLWNPIHITDLNVGSNYLIEITGDITSLVPGDRDITLEARLRTEPPQGNTCFSEISTVRVCGISHGKLTQFSMRRYLELENKDESTQILQVELIADLRSQAENINIKNMFVSYSLVDLK